ncbi:MAG: imidazolonepropionase [Rhodospirillaceae bacterium]|jgi:imidazolonepropionase|nr:imidazolonepropionase [Rhodospirillaceae bacterium]
MSDDAPVARPRASLAITGAAELVTCAAAAVDLVGRVDGGVVAVADEQVIAAGTAGEVERAADLSGAWILDAAGGVVAPGFVDCHTHVVFAGSRVEEYAARVGGADTSELALRGIVTGILATVEMTRAASSDELVASAAERLAGMLRSGTTTAESKSGYGLTSEDEIRMLEVNQRLREMQPVDIVSTFLGAHEFPPERRRAAYIDEIVSEMIPRVAEEGLAEFCDVYCDDGYYSVEESRRILEAGANAGLKPKIHTDAYSHIGGSGLAADFPAVSADHLNHTTEDEMEGLAAAGVIGVVMPGLDFAVAHTRPFDARAMLERGMTLALATDICPGCWLESMQFVIALACRLYGFTPAAALRAATIGGAAALGQADKIGSLEPGKLADIAIFDVPRYEDLAYRLGRNAVRTVIKRGQVVVEASRT